MKPTIKEAQEILKIFLDSELQDPRLEIGELQLTVSKTGAAGVVAMPFSSPTTLPRQQQPQPPLRPHPMLQHRPPSMLHPQRARIGWW